ncbi:MAG: RluA family pseudouridine synthase [Lachnospiraceae bacterium]|nr:RluA family pseudouridine synthase [Lachnospiraceae bacterium]
MNTDRILYEDNDIIVCHKPAGIATQTARVGQADMVSEITNYLAMTTKGSRPYVGVVHRLDQPVEGVLVFAKNRQAAADLGRQIQENRMEKYYYAVVCGRDFKPCGELTDYLLKDGKTNTSRVVQPEVKEAKKAVLDYKIVAEQTCKEAADMALRIALVEIHLHTGRHHQIRVQMSHAGMSLLGDYKYAEPEVVKVSEQMNIKEIALCAYKLSFLHPGTGKLLQFQIEPEGRSFQIHDWKNYADGGSHNGV